MKTEQEIYETSTRTQRDQLGLNVNAMRPQRDLNVTKTRTSPSQNNAQESRKREKETETNLDENDTSLKRGGGMKSAEFSNNPKKISTPIGRKPFQGLHNVQNPA